MLLWYVLTCVLILPLLCLFAILQLYFLLSSPFTSTSSCPLDGISAYIFIVSLCYVTVHLSAMFISQLFITTMLFLIISPSISYYCSGKVIMMYDVYGLIGPLYFTSLKHSLSHLPSFHMPVISYVIVRGITRSPTRRSAIARETMSQFWRWLRSLLSLWTVSTTNRLPRTIPWKKVSFLLFGHFSTLVQSFFAVADKFEHISGESNARNFFRPATAFQNFEIQKIIVWLAIEIWLRRNAFQKLRQLMGPMQSLKT